MNTNQLPTISNYGEYSSDNYGSHTLKVSFPNNFALFYSYDTIIAFSDREGFVISENNWGTTTGKHLNFLERDKKARLPRKEFELKLQEMLDRNFSNRTEVETE